MCPTHLSFRENTQPIHRTTLFQISIHYFFKIKLFYKKKDIKVSSFKSSENIPNKEGGSDRSLTDN